MTCLTRKSIRRGSFDSVRALMGVQRAEAQGIRGGPEPTARFPSRRGKLPASLGLVNGGPQIQGRLFTSQRIPRGQTIARLL